MNLVVKMLYMHIFFIGLSLVGMALPNQALIDRVMNERKLEEASPALQALAQEVLSACGITEPVVILEDPAMPRDVDGLSFRREGQPFMVFPPTPELTEDIARGRTWVAYHETGHIYYNHAGLTKPLAQRMIYGGLAIGTVYFCFSLLLRQSY